ncbi:glucose 1-dehydrogenase [Saccharomonospora iraqiensis]|uniref:glucose 1-dehydrogenase n=1 Tax=Saccharomonospora iraqiensis TaxID=52698 RepID=UPI00022DFFF9|nr:glucose 1-dehydrogenase [Saccharomonospora iraqiensis]
MGRLSGKVALITGAARGQGAAAARRFVDEGARVMVTDVTDDEGKDLAAALGDAAGYEHLDVTDEAQWSAVVARTVAEFGSLDVLVNNAGLLHFAELEHTALADYERVVRVNQTGTFLGMRSVVEPMTAAGGGSIVNVSSVEGLAGMPLVSAYTASKFAIRGMTKVAALELGDKGIRVNSIHPGMIDTDMVRTALGGDVDASPAVVRLALKRMGRPEEIAAMAAFLACDDSSYCTGGEFPVDGGATATHALRL